MAQAPAQVTLVLPAALLDTALRRRLPSRPEVFTPAAADGYAPAAVLCGLFGVATDAAADVPVAALAAAAEIGPPGMDYWLRADPVTLVATGAELRLLDAGVPELAAAEAAALVAWLHEAGSVPGAAWYAPHPARWYLRLPGPVHLLTTPPAALLGRHVEDDLPRGPDGATWRVRLNALQMALHAAPVNAAREARGTVPVSSVWLWGSGCAPAVPAGSYARVAAADPLVQGLARLGGMAQVPEQVPAQLLDGPTGALLAAPENDAGGWLTALLAALRGGDVGMLTVVVLNAASAERYRLARRRWWRAWRAS